MKTIRASIVIRDKSTNKVFADVVEMDWSDEVSLKEIMAHITDAIERIDV